MHSSKDNFVSAEVSVVKARANKVTERNKPVPYESDAPWEPDQEEEVEVCGKMCDLTHQQVFLWRLKLFLIFRRVLLGLPIALTLY